jgi:Cu+-exporting ATPase
VYLLLNKNNLCNYYDLDKNPGIKARGKFTNDRFAYLDDISVLNRLAEFCSDEQVNIYFKLPQMHCSSCIFLLEHLHKINEGVIRSRVAFERKEVFISFDPGKISLRKLVELLAFIGYEPDISLEDNGNRFTKKMNRSRIVELGVAGFCFSNIMMLSFPEYFSGGNIIEPGLKETFTWIIFALSVPVITFSARSLFISAFKSLRQGVVNIDAPIVLASLITFSRSYYEIISGTGAGYLDSGTGIIFFMLIGRWFQSKTYDALAFDRQYRSYFPLGVTVVKNNVEKNIPATALKTGDIIVIRNEEMIPADAILLSGNANIDYSFVSGENIPVSKKTGDILFAGGKQKGSALTLELVKETSQSYITELWNSDVFTKGKQTEASFIHPWSRYFTFILFSIAFCTALYWWYTDVSKLWPAVTAVLIVACPCSLLLGATFSFGNMQRIFGRNKLYLKNASVIEALASIQHIIFDKTGTITNYESSPVQYYGTPLNTEEQQQVWLTAAQSTHALSRSVLPFLNIPERKFPVEHFAELTGKGITATIDKAAVQIGAATFVQPDLKEAGVNNSRVHVSIDKIYKGYYEIKNVYREGLQQMIDGLRQDEYKLHVLSGDNNAEKSTLQQIFGSDSPVHFKVSPLEKLDYIKNISANQDKVLMIGDGLNDAGALMQAHCGIAVSNDTARFTPACDAIMDGSVVNKLHLFMRYARWGKRIVLAAFVLSVCYNFIGISFAVQAKLSPVIAAILMPASSISIVAFTRLFTSAVARRLGL